MIDPVMAPVMIMGNPSHTIDTEKVLRRADIGTGSCSYSLPSTTSSVVLLAIINLGLSVLKR